MKKTTVLFIDHAPLMGGAERSLLMLIKGLDKSRFSVMLACPSDTEFAREALKAGAKVLDVDLGHLKGIKNPLTVLFRLRKGFLQLVKAVREEQVDIIHSNVMRASIYGFLVAWFTGTCHVWHVRDIHRNRLYKAILSVMSDRIVAISQAVKNSLPKGAQAKTDVIYNGIDFSRFDLEETDGRLFRYALGIPADVTLVGNVSWISPWKNQKLFIEAAASIAHRFPNARFVIVGDAADESYQNLVDDLKLLGKNLLRDKLIWAGAQSQMAEVMASLDILVHTANDEPFGMVLVEAMAMGKPVLAPDSGGPAEIVDNGRTGVLFKSGNVESLGQAMADLLESSEYARTLGNEGVHRARELFSSQREAEEFEKLYLRCVD